MSSVAVAGAVLTLAALYIFSRVLWTSWSIRCIPGPFWARFTNLQRLYWVKTGKAHDIHYKLHEKYGKFVRIGPNVISISDPAALTTVYPTRMGVPKVVTLLICELYRITRILTISRATSIRHKGRMCPAVVLSRLYSILKTSFCIRSFEVQCRHFIR
jgi:hypothetical protein